MRDREEITDTFQVVDEDGNRLRVQEVALVDDDQPPGAGGHPPQVYYRLDNGRRLTAYMGAREFRDEQSGAMYDRV